jgi:hypothetical protein
MLTGKRPLPFLTAGGAKSPTNVSLAFSPLSSRINVFNELRKKYSYTNFPAWSTGNSWSQGKSHKGLSATLATITATCGSAFTVNIAEAVERYERTLTKLLGKDLFSKFYTKLEPSKIGNFRPVPPFPLPNPNYGLAGRVFGDEHNVGVTDFGVKRNNGYVESFLALGRDVKILIISDASGGVNGSMLKMEDDHLRAMVKAGIPGFTKVFPKIDYSKITKKEFHIFQSGDYLIIYIPFLNQDDFPSSDTFNTDYKGKTDDMLRMSKKAYKVVMKHGIEITGAIAEFIEGKKAAQPIKQAEQPESKPTSKLPKVDYSQRGPMKPLPHTRPHGPIARK